MAGNKGLKSAPRSARLRGNGSGKGPLRRILYLTHNGGGGVFSHDGHMLECGHTVFSTPGAMRARCWKCKNSEPADDGHIAAKYK